MQDCQLNSKYSRCFECSLLVMVMMVMQRLVCTLRFFVESCLPLGVWPEKREFSPSIASPKKFAPQRWRSVSCGDCVSFLFKSVVTSSFCVLPPPPRVGVVAVCRRDLTLPFPARTCRK